MAVKLQKRAENTRRKILESAVSGFSDGGFSGTTVEDIAASAGVNKQRIYAYFGSKKKLFEAALLAVFQQTAVVSVEAVRRAAAAHFRRFAAAVKMLCRRAGAAHKCCLRL